MLIKIFNNGQVVIPISLRKSLGIEIGDMVEVEINSKKKCLEIRKPIYHKAQLLAGYFSKKKVVFPSKSKMRQALEKGLLNEK